MLVECVLCVVFWWRWLEFFFFIDKWFGIVAVIEAGVLAAQGKGEARFIVSAAVVRHVSEDNKQQKQPTLKVAKTDRHENGIGYSS